MAWQIGKFYVMLVEHHRYVHNLFPFCNKSGEDPGGVAKKKTKIKGIFNILLLVEFYVDNGV